MPYKDYAKKLARQRVYGRAYYERNKERMREYGRQKWHTTPGVKHRRRAKRYGLTPEALTAKLKRAGGRCELCGRETNNLHVDHDHTSGRVRGILCTQCNTCLGIFGDCPALIRKALKWIGPKKCE